MISAADLHSPGYMRAPDEAKPTAQGLWIHTDSAGRRELVPELIAADIYPGRAAVDLVETHLTMLAYSGFLTIYQANGSEWIALTRPLRTDQRGADSDCPPPPEVSAGHLHETARNHAAVGGERERAGESRASEPRGREWAEARVRAEQDERAGAWAEWRGGREGATRMPSRPLLMDAPPIGCPDHPNGRYADCGPCGTARRQHDLWVAQERYTEQLAKVDEPPADDEPF